MFHKPYASLGSGSIYAMSVIENMYKDDMTEEEAKDMVCKSIEAGILHDLMSGSNVDLCIIKKENVEFLRNYKVIHS